MQDFAHEKCIFFLQFRNRYAFQAMPVSIIIAIVGIDIFRRIAHRNTRRIVCQPFRTGIVMLGVALLCYKVLKAMI